MTSLEIDTFEGMQSSETLRYLFILPIIQVLHDVDGREEANTFTNISEKVREQPFCTSSYSTTYYHLRWDLAEKADVSGSLCHCRMSTYSPIATAQTIQFPGVMVVLIKNRQFQYPGTS